MPGRGGAAVRRCGGAVVVAVAVLSFTSSGSPSAGPRVTSFGARSSPTSPVSTEVSPRPVPASWRTQSPAGQATVAYPRRWHPSDCQGAPATVFFPVKLVSSVTLTGRCTSGHHESSACTLQRWFPPDSRVAATRVLVLRGASELPAQSRAFAGLPGRAAMIDRRPGRIRSGSATDSCPAGAAADIDAYVRIFSKTQPGDRFDMRACLGPRVSAVDRQAVYTMLTALRIHA